MVVRCVVVVVVVVVAVAVAVAVVVAVSFCEEVALVFRFHQSRFVVFPPFSRHSRAFPVFRQYLLFGSRLIANPKPTMTCNTLRVPY
jgi:hypothetical protein